MHQQCDPFAEHMTLLAFAPAAAHLSVKVAEQAWAHWGGCNTTTTQATRLQNDRSDFSNLAANRRA